MYGPKWPFLLMYGSHDMRHTGIPRVDGLLTRHAGNWGITSWYQSLGIRIPRAWGTWA